MSTATSEAAAMSASVPAVSAQTKLYRMSPSHTADDETLLSVTSIDRGSPAMTV